MILSLAFSLNYNEPICRKLGEQLTACFLLENNFAFEVVSFLTRVPSQEIMQALEDSVVYSINYFTLQQLYLKYPLLERFGRILMEEQFA